MLYLLNDDNVNDDNGGTSGQSELCKILPQVDVDLMGSLSSFRLQAKGNLPCEAPDPVHE